MYFEPELPVQLTESNQINDLYCCEHYNLYILGIVQHRMHKAREVTASHKDRECHACTTGESVLVIYEVICFGMVEPDEKPWRGSCIDEAN